VFLVDCPAKHARNSPTFSLFSSIISSLFLRHGQRRGTGRPCDPPPWHRICLCKQHLLAYALGILSGSRVRMTRCSPTFLETILIGRGVRRSKE
jgi:hypothetical protein